MHHRYIQNLRLATTYVLRRARRQGTRSGDMPPNVEFRTGQRWRRTEPMRPVLRFLLWSIPGWLLLGSALVAHGTPGVKSAFTGAMLAAAAVAMGLGAAIGEPRRASSWWILGVNFAAIGVYFTVLASL